MHIDYFKVDACIINDAWQNVDTVIAKMQQYPIHVQGDGFCFLYIVQEALSKDHLKLLQTGQII